MGETDVIFRHLLRGLPRPILRLAFPRRRLEPLGPLDPSVGVDRPRQRTADSLFRVRDSCGEAAVHVEIERAWRQRSRASVRVCERRGGGAATAGMVGVVLLLPGGCPRADTGVYSFPVTPDVRARIDGAPDVARLESWLEAAVTAGAIGDVFRDG